MLDEKTLKKLLDENTNTNDVLKEAVQEHQKEQNEKSKKKLIVQLRFANGVLNNKVNILRKIRKEERSALKDVTTVNNAYEEFVKTGDFQKFKKAMKKLKNKLSSSQFFGIE